MVPHLGNGIVRSTSPSSPGPPIPANSTASTPHPGHRGGVSYRNGATNYFNNDQGDGHEHEAALLPARLMSLHQHGRTRQLADLSVFEGPHNPDGKTVYSVRDAAVVALGADMDMTIHLCMLGHRYYAQAVRTVITVSGEWLYYTVLHYTVLPAAMASGVAVSGHTLAALTNVLADPGGSLVTMRLRQLGFAGVGPVLS